MPKVSTSYKPGQSGNPKGRPPKEWTWSGLIREHMEKQGLDGKAVKDAVSASLIAKALEGDVAALKEIGNRLDGMPKQAVEHSGDALTVQIVQGGHEPNKK